MKYYLYILLSEKHGKYYIGISQNPARRLEYHNIKEKGFTSRYRPWKVIYMKEYETKAEALKAERKVKKWKSRKMIELLIAGNIKV